MKHGKLETERAILISMTLSGVVAVLPFAIIRLMHGETLLFALDITLVAGLVFLGAYVWRTHRTVLASYAVSIMSMAAIIGTVYIKGPQQIYWAFPTVLIIFYLLQPVEALILNLLGLSILLPKLILPMASESLMTVFFTLAVTITFSYAFSSRTADQRKQLIMLATKDPLTGAENRRALSERLREIIATHRRRPVTASMLMVDLDNFKRINDELGHAVGDRALTKLVQLIRQRIRETDSVYRVGGEEFLIIAEGATATIADTLGEDLRVLVETAKLVDGRSVTISVGIAELFPEEETDDWLRRTDNALYAAKNGGRNRCVRAREQDASVSDITEGRAAS
ncbi:MAG: GGDEF domain-containing protein [Pseudomonadota bacterium]